MVQEGYEKFHGAAFKVSTIGRYIIVISGSEMYNDIRKAAKEQLSFREAAAEILQSDYMLGSQIRTDPFHLRALHIGLTKNFGSRFDDIIDELSTSFQELIPSQSEWVKVPVFDTIKQVVCRTSNRVYVGLPLCRNSEYQELHVTLTPEVFKGSQIINIFPQALKPLVGRYLTKLPKKVDRLVSHIGPIIHERLENEKNCGPDWPDKPNDMLTWLLDVAEGHQKDPKEIAIQLFTVAFASIHTSSMALTQAIYDLAAHPQYITPLREEIEQILKTEGWTKRSQGNMHKLDSFIKESHRLSMDSMIMHRLALQEFTFSNGITVPSGSRVAFAASATHKDEANYKDPHEFKGFRFAEAQGADAETVNHQFVSLSSDYVVFGTGRAACPGRFFAANEIKAMLAYILLNYDIKLVDENRRPVNLWFSGFCSPHPTADVLFRKRTVVRDFCSQV